MNEGRSHSISRQRRASYFVHSKEASPQHNRNNLLRGRFNTVHSRFSLFFKTFSFSSLLHLSSVKPLRFFLSSFSFSEKWFTRFSPLSRYAYLAMKGTDIIRRDHRAAEDLFDEYKKASKEKREELAEKIFEALETHESMEDTYFYPALDEAGDSEPLVSEIEQEQEELAEEVERVRMVEGERDSEMREIMEKVLAHAKKEERDILPFAERILDAEELENLGEKMEMASAVANS